MNVKEKYYVWMKRMALLFSFTFISVFASAQHYTEYEVKAGYLYNFTNFINWPEGSFSSAEEPFIIGIYGKDPFGMIINQVLKGQKLNGRSWKIKYYFEVGEIDKCHMLFVSRASKTELLAIAEKIKNKPVLTVGDEIEEFCESGGIINFSGKYEKKRFQINNNSALKVKLVISSKLLALSRIISENEIKF